MSRQFASFAKKLMETKRNQVGGLLKVSKADPTFHFYSASGDCINIDASNKHQQTSTGVRLTVFQRRAAARPPVDKAMHRVLTPIIAASHQQVPLLVCNGQYKNCPK